jgi:hypothetical protein
VVSVKKIMLVSHSASLYTAIQQCLEVVHIKNILETVFPNSSFIESRSCLHAGKSSSCSLSYTFDWRNGHVSRAYGQLKIIRHK